MQWLVDLRTCACVSVWQGFAQSLLKRMSQRSTIPGCGVTFEIVSNIPGVSTRPGSYLLGRKYNEMNESSFQDNASLQLLKKPLKSRIEESFNDTSITSKWQTAPTLHILMLCFFVFFDCWKVHVIRLWTMHHCNNKFNTKYYLCKMVIGH